MNVISTLESLDQTVASLKQAGKLVGFVPTMGALHAGHMALVERAKKECDVVISSVFVNPTQFNNPKDLELYPRTPEKDAALLAAHGCDFVFFPTVEMMYPTDLEFPVVDLGEMERIMEGAFRPGHFKGVVQVVWRFFSLVQPDKAYFGLKDFQQVAVIKHMVRSLNLPIEIVPCPTLREPSGLAMSSRNMRLSDQEKEEALVIFKTLSFLKAHAGEFTPTELTQKGKELMNASTLRLEYLQIVDPITLLELTSEWTPGATACLSAYCGEVRLIDNMKLIEERQ